MRFDSKHHSDGGFALVATLTLLVLIMILLVGLLQLSAVNQRSKAQGTEMTEARANAKLGIMLAIGDLQKHTGPDQRVTAPASILDTNPATLQIDGVTAPEWIGVWGTTTNGASSPADHGSLNPDSIPNNAVTSLGSFTPELNAAGKLFVEGQNVAWDKENDQILRQFEGKSKELGVHTDGVWLKFPVIREDTNDSRLVLTSETLTGPNL